MKNKEKDIIKKGSSMLDKDIMPKVFDWNGLLYRLMGDEDLAKEIVDDFMKDIPNKLNALKEALNKGDALLIKKEAHMMKGASGNIGAVAMQEIAEQIEIAGKAEDLVKAELLTAKYEALLEIFKKNINRP
ncbi:MAG: Hpt domain-containing protein [Desulfobacterales bacterium]